MPSNINHHVVWIWEGEQLIDVLNVQSSPEEKGGFCIFYVCAYLDATLVENHTNQIATCYNSPCFMQNVRRHDSY